MERRWFFSKVAAIGVGATALWRGARAWAAGLPSDPDAKRKEAGPDEILLPAFAKDSTYPLVKAIVGRKSERDFDAGKNLSLEEVSQLLWAANGVNRTDGHRTTPSALARYPIEVYVSLPDGIYLYENKEHKLTRISGDDIRSKVPITQPGLSRAAMQLLFVFNKSRIPGSEEAWGDLEIGCMVQDVYLMAGSLGLSSCVFALVNYARVTRLIGLKDNQKLRIAQAVGHLQ